MVRGFEKDTKAVKDELMRITWFMRGGVSYSEAHAMTREEREIASKIIEDNLKTTKESQLPFF